MHIVQCTFAPSYFLPNCGGTGLHGGGGGGVGSQGVHVHVNQQWASSDCSPDLAYQLQRKVLASKHLRNASRCSWCVCTSVRACMHACVSVGAVDVLPRPDQAPLYKCKISGQETCFLKNAKVTFQSEYILSVSMALWYYYV